MNDQTKLERQLERLPPDRADVIRDMIALGWEPHRFRGKNPSWEFVRTTDEGERERFTVAQQKICRKWMAHICWRFEAEFREHVEEALNAWLDIEIGETS